MAFCAIENFCFLSMFKGPIKFKVQMSQVFVSKVSSVEAVWSEEVKTVFACGLYQNHLHTS